MQKRILSCCLHWLAFRWFMKIATIQYVDIVHNQTITLLLICEIWVILLSEKRGLLCILTYCVAWLVFIVSTHLSIILRQSLSVAIGLGENNAQRNLFFIQMLLSVLTRFGIKMDAKIQKSSETKKESLKDVSCIYLLLFCFTCVYVSAPIGFFWNLKPRVGC